MGRTPNATPQAVVVHEKQEAVAAGRAALDEVGAHQSEVSTRFDGGLPYDRTRVVNEARFYMAQSAEAMLEAGKRLIVLKENEPHGVVEGIFRDQLGIPERTAQRMMQASLKFMSPQLQAKAPALALLGKTKLFELITEDDEDLAGLADGGTLAGKTLDEFDRMTTREMKIALRKGQREKQEEAEATQRAVKSRDADIAAKQAEIDRLQRELAGKQAAQPPEPEPELPGAAALEALAAAALDVVARIDVAFRQHFMAAERAFGDDVPPNHVRLAQQQALTQVIQAAKVLAADHGVDLPLSAATPAELTWLANMEAVEALRTDDGTPTGLVVPNAWGDAEDAELLDAEGAGHGQ